eukprot:COSAG01_NODE_49533_length_371_cov_0.941176_2_plen_31_part_01
MVYYELWIVGFLVAHAPFTGEAIRTFAEYCA